MLNSTNLASRYKITLKKYLYIFASSFIVLAFAFTFIPGRVYNETQIREKLVQQMDEHEKQIKEQIENQQEKNPEISEEQLKQLKEALEKLSEVRNQKRKRILKKALTNGKSDR